MNRSIFPKRRAKMTEGYDLAFVIGGLFLSLSAFSLIVGDNYRFRLGAAILSGAISAYVCVLLAENYFYPLILDLVSGDKQFTAAELLRTAAAAIGIILLFCKAYTTGKTGGRVILTILLAVSAAVLVLGAAGGTIPAFIRSLAAQFRIAALPAEERSNVWYWVRSGTVLFSAVIALLYTRHYRFTGKRLENGSSGSFIGNILVGFTFGAIAAAVFLTAANILVNHVFGLIGTIQSLIK